MEPLFQSLSKAFGWSILNSLWQGAAVYGLLFIVMVGFPKMKARLRYNLAFGSLVLMFGLFLATFARYYERASTIVVSAPVQVTGQHLLKEKLKELPLSFGEKAEAYFPVIVAAYLLGMLLQCFIVWKGYSRLNNLRKTGLQPVPEEWQVIFNRVSAAIGLKRAVGFSLSALVKVPMVAGYLKPVVLFPFSLVSQMDAEQVEAILIHELSHIRRNDYLFNLLKTAIETLLFFNPFVWLAGRFVHIEREHACDDLVLKHTNKPLDYAHTLLKLEIIRDTEEPAAMAMAANGQPQHLYQRIKRITNMKTNYLNIKHQLAALTFALACIVSVAWISPKKAYVKKQADKQVKMFVATQGDATIAAFGSTNLNILQDTTKKKRQIRIITTDAKGRTHEYRSFSELPDSLKAAVYSADDVNNLVRTVTDSAYLNAVRNQAVLITKRFNSPQELAKWQKFGEDMQRKLASPEQQAKWKKMGEELAKRFNSPEEQAKWEKYGKEIEKKFNSPEEQAKWKKFGEDMEKRFNSPEMRAQIRRMDDQLVKQFSSAEAQAQWKKLGEDMERKFNSPEEQAKWKKLGEDMERKFNSPEEQAKWKKLGEDMQRKFNSPEEQAKWKKLGEDMERKFNSPEAQAKWNQLAGDMEKQFNSPEAQAKWQKFADELAAQFSSPEALAKWEKLGKDVAERVNTPDFQANVRAMQGRVNSVEWKKRQDGMTRMADSMHRKFDSPAFRMNHEKMKLHAESLRRQFDSPEWKAKMAEFKALKDNKEFQALQKKYNEDVEKLRRKVAEEKKKQN
ncbi:peptidase M56 [Pedobacter yulinensis]|uniref:Peptidase M56 n=1 Tax=Pedobacter yulinensis TaxID=2126353 RepID=A0A2T3HHT9_9SPHI|nr:M56 family metallopeptidase [Pedobacter yulinensis]PST82005.1 peptidase M56 [Pedobacter yulinensis]